MAHVNFYRQDMRCELVECGRIDLEEAVELLSNFPRAEEVRHSLAKGGQCRPLIGFQNADSSFLEFAICADSTLHVRFSQPQVRSVLEINFGSHQEMESVEVLNIIATQLLELFFEGQETRVLELMIDHNRNRK